MSDLISRQAAIDAVHEEFDDCLVWDESGQRTADEFEIIIDRLPSAEKTGHNLRADTPSLFECSVCGWSCWDTYAGDSEYKYCPNCGARVVEE